jgi:hypothetical protein
MPDATVPTRRDRLSRRVRAVRALGWRLLERVDAHAPRAGRLGALLGRALVISALAAWGSHALGWAEAPWFERWSWPAAAVGVFLILASFRVKEWASSSRRERARHQAAQGMSRAQALAQREALARSAHVYPATRSRKARRL